MATIKKAAEAAPISTDTKVHNISDAHKVLAYFRHAVGTTLDAMFATGVLRNSITYYVQDLMRLGLLQVVYVAPDRYTHRMAKYYSADPSKWSEKRELQYSLDFAEE